jgi:cell wall-associated NlpC family hydrolase
MTIGELEILTRAHELFSDGDRGVALDSGNSHHDRLLERAADLNTGGGHERYRSAVGGARQALRAAGRTDEEIDAVLVQARQDHTEGRVRTKAVVDAARADAALVPDNPVAEREAMRRRAARLREQRAHVLSARLRARRRVALLRALRYRALRRGVRLDALRLPPPDSRAGIVVRAALSRLGRPYVWGATGPDQFDCSGLTKWAYERAGIHLDRTTYQQINDGIPVPRSRVRPGDLVFPHAGHVQMAIGNGQVVEAPHAGATVRISPLGSNVQIRRPA